MEQDLILSLLYPRQRVARDGCPDVCEIRLTFEGEEPITITVVWAGKGCLAYVLSGDSSYWRRSMRSHPIDSSYIDECLALRGLIRSLLSKDEAEAEKYRLLLTQSVWGGN